MWWSRIDKLLTRIEKKGYHVANRAHIYSVNILIFASLYAGYTIFRDYNNYFLEARVSTHPSHSPGIRQPRLPG